MDQKEFKFVPMEQVEELELENENLKQQLKKKKPKEFTKSMYKYNVVFVTIIVFLSFVLMFISSTVTYIELSPISVIIPSAFAELGMHTGFVIWKSKCENIHKYPDIIAEVKKVEEVINNV